VGNKLKFVNKMQGSWAQNFSSEADIYFILWFFALAKKGDWSLAGSVMFLIFVRILDVISRVMSSIT